MLVYTFVALGSALFLEGSRVFWREELQTINRRFEARNWLVWTKESLQRLSIPLLWQYHQAHEIPREWWAWDYTLSWLIENNHQPVKHKVIVFNHQLEDEPPLEAVKEHPWMSPLIHHPLSRATMGDIVEFLGKSGVRLIILDNDFPQYSPDDAVLARAVHKCASAELSGYPVPVLMARTVNRRSTANTLQLEVPSTPSGILDSLAELEPDTNVRWKYTGITGILPDEDQVVRRIALKLPGLAGEDHESIVLKALSAMKEPVPPDTPAVMDIDFSAPPNSELYPVRPLSYLIDPDRRQAMTDPDPKSSDVTLAGAVVLLGDSVIDVFNTPFTNVGVNQMSGSEVLAHSLETVSRKSWPTRLEGWQSLAYLALLSVTGGAVWVLWKQLQQSSMGLLKATPAFRLLRISSDLACFLLTICGTYWLACLLFAYKGLLVPVFVPGVALGLGAFAAMIWEKEREREETFKVKLQATQEKLKLAQERYEADLKRQEAEAKNREILLDRQRRHEFVRRINHDLNAPVSVLNWTLCELQEERLDSDTAKEKVGRLVKNSDKLCELIDQLVESYDFETQPETGESPPGTCDLNKVLQDSLDLQIPLAEMHRSKLTWTLPDNTLWVRANALELSRVIDNLVRNAIKHNPQGTNVAVQLRSNGAFHEVDVCDNGRGIDAEHLKHIFEPGYRVEPSRQDGQGLGLDIVKSLVDRIGGEISLESAVGHGTTFKVRLPICTAPDESTNYNNGGSVGNKT